MSEYQINILKASEISDLVINSLPGVFYVQDEEGNYLRWNKNLELVSGYSAEEIKKLKPLDFFEAHNHQRIQDVIHKVFEEGEAEINIEAVVKDGRKIPFYLNGKAVIYEGRRCLMGVGIDISEKVTAENERMKNESYLHALFDNVGGSVFLLDSEKRLVFHNDELAKKYEWLTTRQPRPGDLAYDFLPPDEMKARHEILDRVLQGKKEVIEISYERNGERNFFRTGFSPVYTNDKITGISCYTIDIIPNKKAELETQKIQERLNYHINNSPLAVLEYDKELRVTFWSKRTKEIFGWGEEEVMGKKITDFLIHKDDVATVASSLLSDDHPGSKPIATKNYTKDGRIVHSRWHSSFLTDENGNVDNIMSIVRDITDLHKAELQKEAMANDLIKRNNDLEQFTYIVSHNLRAPIARVIGLADILSEFELSEEEKAETIQGISQSAHRLDDIIKDLNAILHIKGNLNENKENVSFSALVNDIEQNIRHFNKDEFTIETDFSAADNYYTIKNYLVSIFSNLISNSIKYRQAAVEPLISIKSEKTDQHLILSFRDNGIGFDMSKKGGEIFGLYKRFHFHVEGKGLGLFMVKSQVETLGGRIEVFSEENKGSEFRITFDI